MIEMGKIAGSFIGIYYTLATRRVARSSRLAVACGKSL
jgi:hypothetical protein